MSFSEVCPAGDVAVLTDVHTNEWTSEDEYDLYALLDESNIPGVWAMRANELTWRTNRMHGRNERYTHRNLQLITPEYAAANPAAYEVRRKQEIMVATAAAGLVLEPHANKDEVSYAWYGQNASPIIRGVASYLGFDKAILMPPTLIGAGRTNHVMLDYDTTRKSDYLPSMVGTISKLAEGWEPEPGIPGVVQEYDLVGSLSVDDTRRLGIQDEYPPFGPLASEDEQKLVQLGIPLGCVPLFWSYEKYGERIGCIAEMVRLRTPLAS